jgi:cytochrome P450
MGAPLHDDLFAPEVTADPYTYFGRLRDEDPIHWNREYGVWILTRYDDVVWAARNTTYFSSEIYQRDPRPPYPPIDADDMELYRAMKVWMGDRFMHRDRPGHTGMRQVIHESFSAGAIERWRPVVAAETNGLLDQAEARGRMDVIADFAVPLPVLVIAEMLALPAEDRPFVRRMTEKATFLDSADGSRLQVYVAAIEELAAYLQPLVAARLANPGDDVLSALAGAERRGLYTRQEVLANIVMLLFAGHETTISLICNGTLAFIRHPEQWASLQQGLSPAQLVRATEECLRYDPPVKAIQRIVIEDVDRRGTILRKGDRVLWCISSANRDPGVFAQPDTFDISRFPNGHASFGAGIHHCLGATLARMEGQEAFKALAQRFRTLRLETERLTYHPSLSLRSLTSLSVGWS